MQETTLCQAHRLLRTTRLLYQGFLQNYIAANTTTQENIARYKMAKCKEVIDQLVAIINSSVPAQPTPAPVEAFYHQTAAQNA